MNVCNQYSRKLRFYLFLFSVRSVPYSSPFPARKFLLLYRILNISNCSVQIFCIQICIYQCESINNISFYSRQSFTVLKVLHLSFIVFVFYFLLLPMNYNGYKKMLLPQHNKKKFLTRETQHHLEWLSPYDDSEYAPSKNVNIEIVCMANSRKICEYFLFYEQVHAQPQK